MDLRTDEEFAALIPASSEEEQVALEESLVAHGCRDPLVVWAGRGVILDGHTRFRICSARGIRFATVEQDLPDRASAMAWIITNQLARRNLNDWQRGRLVLRRKAVLAAQARLRMEAGWKNRKPGEEDPVQNSVQGSDEDRSGRVQTQLADMAGVSHDTMHKIAVLEARGKPEIRKALDEGTMSINKAYRKTMDRKHAQSVAQHRARGQLGPCGKCPCCKAWLRKTEEGKR